MSATQPIISTNLFPEDQDSISIQCPQCHQPLGRLEQCDPGSSADSMTCAECGFCMEKVNGVWRALTLQQHHRHRIFLSEYEELRRREGRGSNQAAFYLTLPFSDLTRRFTWQWKIRAKSYRMLEKHILPKIEAEHPEGLRILDLGAGNGWLSYRLALRNHFPWAVDLSADPWDGLEAARHYQPVLYQFFPRVQAEMDCLPFNDRQFDLVIFNASFHYSAEYGKTLREALRCLTAQGKILIIDSPTYSTLDQGLRMQQERHLQFERTFGFPPQHAASKDFLTPSMIESWSDLNIEWETYHPWYGLKWALRPWIAKLRGRRVPSRFHIYLGHVRNA